MLVWRRLFFHHELNLITDMTFVIEHLVVSVRELLPEEIELGERRLSPNQFLCHSMIGFK